MQGSTPLPRNLVYKPIIADVHPLFKMGTVVISKKFVIQYHAK